MSVWSAKQEHKADLTPVDLEALADAEEAIGRADRAGKSLWRVTVEWTGTCFARTTELVWAADENEAEGLAESDEAREPDADECDWTSTRVAEDAECLIERGPLSDEDMNRLEADPRWAGERGQLFLGVVQP